MHLRTRKVWGGNTSFYDSYEKFLLKIILVDFAVKWSWWFYYFMRAGRVTGGGTNYWRWYKWIRQRMIVLLDLWLELFSYFRFQFSISILLDFNLNRTIHCSLYIVHIYSMVDERNLITFYSTKTRYCISRLLFECFIVVSSLKWFNGNQSLSLIQSDCTKSVVFYWCCFFPGKVENFDKFLLFFCWNKKYFMSCYAIELHNEIQCRVWSLNSKELK